MKNLAAITGVALVAIYVIGSGLWVNTGDNWYRNLNAPAWQPPDFIFGLIWPYNFIALGITAFVVSRSLSRTLTFTWLGFFAASVFAALLWSYLFYMPHNLIGAATALITAAILTIPLTIITFRVSIGYGLALLPYQIWVAIAASLSWGYWHLARLT